MEDMEHRENEGTVKVNAVSVVILFGVGIVDANESGDLGGRRIRVCVVGICFKNGQTESCREGKKEAHARLFDA